MKTTSRLFGEFTYSPEQIVTFAMGLLGFEKYTKYVLKASKQTAPIVWLLSVEDGGPELALLDPSQASPEFSLAGLDPNKDALQTLHAAKGDQLLKFAVVTLPENIRKMSMNLRAPILMNPAEKRGLQYLSPELERKPVRCFIYRELISSRPEDKQGTLLMHRKPNETIEIGDEVTVQILEWENGGVRLSISAPRSMKVSRGEGKVTAKHETMRAADHMNLRKLEGIMKMHQVMEEPQEALLDAVSESRKELSVG